MCVIAGYLGTQPAAPVLIAMLQREEGFAGGFYTGLATVAEGQLHWDKVVGDVAALLATTDAAALPGNVGIMHSRSPSGGGREWSHPFVSCDERLAYIANGAPGVFAESTDLAACGNALLAQDHCFRSATAEAVGSYPVLSDGSCVHLSDVLCHLVEQRLAETGDLVRAATAAYQEAPAEVVGMVLHADTPDRIVAMGINYPLVIGFDATGAYLASTSMAFPPSVTSWQPLPPNCAATVTAHRVTFHPFPQPPRPVAAPPSDPALRAACLEALRNAERCHLGDLARACQPLWPQGALAAVYPAVFPALAQLVAEGTAELVTERIPGMDGAGTVPRTWARLVG